MSNADKVLEVARKELGYSRWTDPQAGTKYGRWYAGIVGDKSFGVSGVPYCGMFVSWVFDQAGAKCSGVPGAYTPTMLSIAKTAGRVRPNKKDAQPGDVLYFNWDGGVVDHVGIVEKNFGSYVQTIEGNTSNGQVARRTRSWDDIEAVVIPAWASVVAPPEPTPTNGDYEINGWWDRKFTLAMQVYFGTMRDGAISGQDRTDMNRVNKGGLLYETWQIGKGGSQLVKAWQKHIGMPANKQDGYFGYNTCIQSQKFLGTTQDGYISGPSNMVKEMKKRLKAGTL